MKQALYATTAILGLLALAFLALWPHKAGAVPSPGGEMCVQPSVMHQTLAARGLVLPRDALRAPPGTVIGIIRGRQHLTVVVRRDGRVCAGGAG